MTTLKYGDYELTIEAKRIFGKDVEHDTRAVLMEIANYLLDAARHNRTEGFPYTADDAYRKAKDIWEHVLG